MLFSPKRRNALALTTTVGIIAATLGTLAPAQAADSSTQLTVVGTSDVSDSNLMQAVIKPAFEAAHPGVTLKYVSQGTGAAIATAKSGAASALIVHAAALENQFVGDGYSHEQYGRAIFWGDYILAGTNADPAGVAGPAAHDIVTAYEKIATAGAGGTATFVSRGGTPGTTVQEHAIWALTSGVSLCDVSAANGGGKRPSTSTGPCPAAADPQNYPAWYKTTGVTQAPNIQQGDVCSPGSFPNGGCYVFTDRGTFQYLKSTNAISNLKIVTRDNDAAARGGFNTLVNSFHAYAIEPTKFTDPSVQAGINLPLAMEFLRWITSPAAQTAIGDFLSADSPFLPSAAPKVTITSKVPKAVAPGKKFKVTGTIKNVVPGTPALNGVQVRLQGQTSSKAESQLLTSATTDANGNFTLVYTPKQKMTYTVGVPTFTKVEDSTLNPVFGDILTGAPKTLGSVKVASAVSISVSAFRTSHLVLLRGTLKPGTVKGAKVSVYVQRPGSKAWKRVTVKSLGAGHVSYRVGAKLPSGTWRLRVKYSNTGKIIDSYSAPRTVRVP